MGLIGLTQGGVIGGLAAIDANRVAEKRNRRDRIAALQGERAQQVQRLRVTRVGGQQLPIDQFGLAQVARAMKGDRSLQRFVGRVHDAPRSPSTPKEETAARRPRR